MEFHLFQPVLAFEIKLIWMTGSDERNAQPLECYNMRESLGREKEKNVS